MAGEPNESSRTGSAAGPAPGPDPEPDPQPDPEPEPQPEPQPDPEPEPQRDPEPEPRPEPQPVPDAASRAEALDESGATASGATADPGPLVTETVSAPGPDGEPMRATRQVSAITRDTARPEGGGRAAPADAPAPARQWPVIAVLATTGAGLFVTGLGRFRVGTLLIGLALILGAVLRWCLPSVGMLAVRSRFTDMLTYGLLGLVIVLLALMVQPKPWLVIPFLDEVLHFTLD